MTTNPARSLHPTTLGLLILLGSCHELSQAQQWGTPATMHIYDAAAKTIRPLIGVVGSSYLGPVILDSVDWASIAPNQKSALVLRGGVLSWVPDLTAADLGINVGSFSLSDAPMPRQAIWAAEATGAVVLARETPRLYWLGQCATGFCVQAGWDLDSSQTNWSLLAVDPSLNRALVASQNSLSSQLWIVSQDNAPATIAGLSVPAAAAFAADGLRAYVADAVAHQIVVLVGLDKNLSVIPSAVGRQYVSDPVGLALSSDGTRLFLVDGPEKTIRVFQISTGVLRAELQLRVTPLSLIPHSATTFRLVGSDQNPSCAPCRSAQRGMKKPSRSQSGPDEGRQREIETVNSQRVINRLLPEKGQPFFFLDTREDGFVYFVPAGQ